MKLSGVILGAALTVATSVTSVRAQEPPPPAGEQARPPAAREGRGLGQGGQAPAGVTPAEITRMLNAMLLVRAQEVLQLRDEQYAPFIKALTAFQATRQRLENQRNRLMRDVRTSLQQSAPDAVVADHLKALREHTAQADAARRQTWDAIDQVLDVRQQARFRVLEQDMERQQLELVMRARGAARGAARGR